MHDSASLSNSSIRLARSTICRHRRRALYPKSSSVLLDRLLREDMDPLGPDYVHACVESTKLAFSVRDRHITDPDYMDVDPQTFLASDKLDAMAAKVSMTVASPWPRAADPADTVWLGVMDGNGVAVSFIQSVYHEFGSGIVLPNSGINWQNRGCSFSLDPNARNALAPGRRPFPYAEPAAGALHRWPHNRLWRDGRRWSAAIAKRRLLAHRQVWLGPAIGGQRAALAARPHLGAGRAIRSNLRHVFRTQPSRLCAPVVTKSRACRPMTKPWAMQARLFAIRMARLKVVTIRAATALPLVGKNDALDSGSRTVRAR